jgi:hypothetical protein
MNDQYVQALGLGFIEQITDAANRSNLPAVEAESPTSRRTSPLLLPPLARVACGFFADGRIRAGD